MNKKIIVTGLVALMAPTLFANDYCRERQKLEARIALAKDNNVSAAKVSVIRFEPGIWTEAVGNNTGTDRITVAIQRGDDDPAIETYTVSARQIGTSADCRVTGIRSGR